MTKTTLIDKLDRATDRAVTLAVSRGLPLRISKKSTMVGNIIVEQNLSGYYDIVDPCLGIIYSNISLFDVAVIVAQRYCSGQTSIIRKVLALEGIYSKHRTDMVHYLSCLKGAKKNRDIERMAILEDKFQIAEIAAKQAKDNISIFKRIK